MKASMRLLDACQPGGAVSEGAHQKAPQRVSVRKAQCRRSARSRAEPAAKVVLSTSARGRGSRATLSSPLSTSDRMVLQDGRQCRGWGRLRLRPRQAAEGKGLPRRSCSGLAQRTTPCLNGHKGGQELPFLRGGLFQTKRNTPLKGHSRHVHVIQMLLNGLPPPPPLGGKW